MSETIRVNFDRPIPIFPLPDTVLLPHEYLPLHIFEPRYLQLVGHCLDYVGQMAIATFREDYRNHPTGDPVPLRDAACVGQIIRHERFPDGRYLLVLHGVCRANIREVMEPSDARAYRIGRMEPLETQDQDPDAMPEVRETLRELLRGPRLQRLCGADRLMKWIESDNIPTRAVLELVGFTVLHDTERKYELLAEPCPTRRAAILTDELRSLDRLVRVADRQAFRKWPKGMSWN